MSITVSNIVSGPFIATGAEQTLHFAFKVFTPREIEVLVGEGAATVLLDDVHYAVSSNVDASGQVAEGGRVVLSAGSVVAGAYVRLIARPDMDQAQAWSDTGSRLRNLNEALDRAVLRDLRMRYDTAGGSGGGGGGGVDLRPYAKRDATNMSDEDMAAWSARLGLNLNDKGLWNAATNTPTLVSSEGVEGAFYTVSVAGTTSLDGEAVWEVGDRAAFTAGKWARVPAGATRSARDVYVEDYGAKASDAAFDNTAAINAAEAFAKANGGRVVFLAGKSYYFKGTLTGDRTDLNWHGDRTKLIYNGASTTRNLIVIGNASTERRRVLLNGLVIQSATKMTAGCAVYADRIIEGVFQIDLQTQAGNEALGNNLWNGFWLRHGATVLVRGQSFEGQNEGVIVNGAPGLTGGKSDLFIDVNKIAAWKVGVHVAGAWGGIYLSDHTTLIANVTHFLEDQALTSENNREVFATGTTFDFTSNATLAPGTGGKSIMLMGPGECLFDFRSCWMAGGVGSIFYIGPNSQARVTITGTRGFICGPDPVDATLKGDFLTVDSTNCDVQLVGCNIKSMSGWAINQRAVGANIYYSGCVFLNNTLGHVNPAIPITPGIFTDNGPARFYRVVETDTFRISNGISQSTYWKMDAGMPVFAYEAQSFHRYNPSTKKIDWFLNNQTSLQIAPKGVSLRSQPFLAYEYITGTLDSAGNAAVPTGTVSPFTVLFGFVSVVDGAAAGRTAEVQVQSESGMYYISMNNAAHAGKNFRGIVFYLTGE